MFFVSIILFVLSHFIGIIITLVFFTSLFSKISMRFLQRRKAGEVNWEDLHLSRYHSTSIKLSKENEVALGRALIWFARFVLSSARICLVLCRPRSQVGTFRKQQVEVWKQMQVELWEERLEITRSAATTRCFRFFRNNNPKPINSIDPGKIAKIHDGIGNT